MNKEVKNDEDLLSEVKQLLRKSYEKILIAYKYLSSQLGSSIPQIGENTLIDFFNNCHELFNTKFVTNDILIQATTVKGFDIEERKRKNSNIPNNIVRHQFLYLLVKIATSNYILTNNLKPKNNAEIIVESLSIAFTKFYPSVLTKYTNPNDWRIERYYNEYVDNFLKTFIPVLDAVFKSSATRKDPSRRE